MIKIVFYINDKDYINDVYILLCKRYFQYMYAIRISDHPVYGRIFKFLLQIASSLKNEVLGFCP